MHRVSIVLLSLLVGVASCGDEDSSPSTPHGGAVASGGSGGAGAAGGGGAGGAGDGGSGGAGGVVSDPCAEAAASLPSGLTVLTYDDGAPASHVREQDWVLNGESGQYAVAEETLHEAVRFELAHPAKIHGFELMWADLPSGVDPQTPFTAGIYPDFGYNGFDFWPEPIWNGCRTAAAVSDGEWLSYTLAEPIVVDHPGLVYVAHLVDGPDVPVWYFDGSYEGEGDCSTFAACQSAWNLPEADTELYYNGLSLWFPYHYMVRLHVEYTDDVQPADTIFQQVVDSPQSGHVSWGDYDGDGFDDLLLGGPKLHRNDGDGTFTDVTAAAGLDGISGTGGVWGDYDNDGCLDLFIFAESHTTADTLLHANCDGTFTDVTAAAGIIDEQSYNPCGDPQNNIRSPSAAAAWLDIDADGLLDLYIANFNCWDDYSFYIDTIFRNQGDGTFAEWTGTHGFPALATPSRGASPVDHDGDGDVDLFVNNYVLIPNLFYENDGDGTVTERAKDAGLAGDMIKFRYGHTIGAAWGDIDGDGDFDNISANLAHPRFFDFSDKTQVLINDGAGEYSDMAGDWSFPASDAGLRYQETHSVPVLADFDHDGALDLMITCVYEGRPTDFYWGNGDGTFTLDAYHAGITTQNGWGAAAADYDHDGDPDLFATHLFENTMAVGQGHWLQVRAVGNVASNWAAIGATVEVTAGGVAQIRHVQGGTGKGGQDSLYLHFGLGAATSVDQISVTYPAVGTVVYPGPIAADQRVWVFEDGSAATGWAPPP